jgi:SAM-dependent methyltransferase
MGGSASYDEIGRTYTATRQTDPRLAAAIWEALGEARSVLNVGAGAGAYEPPDREVVAVEPSEVMIRQRPAGAARVVQANAEALPFDDARFDAVMAVLSDHHWSDRAAGLRELRRVARRRVVLVNVDPAHFDDFWLNAEYLPGFMRLVPDESTRPGAWAAGLGAELGPVHTTAIPIAHDCRDGFYCAFWRRPRAYLDARVRQGISVFARLDEHEVTQGVAALAADLDSGAWEQRHRDLLELDELDLGYRVAVAEVG